MRCVKCQHVNQFSAKFCCNCGTSLDNLSPRNNQTQLQSPQLESHYLDDRQFQSLSGLPDDARKGERKYITALCSDLSGYTAMCESLDPETVKEIMKQIFGDIAKVVVDYEGFIEKFIGDAVMALFGVPKTHEDDPIRAVRAARKIHQLVAEYRPPQGCHVGKSLTMKTGIYTGLVVTGEINLQYGTHGIAGEPLNRASRLCGAAGSGEILVGHATYCRNRDFFSFKNLGGIKAKGVAEPIRTYKVISPKSQSEIMVSTESITAGFVGRQSELLRMQEIFIRLRERRQGGITFIIGNAGVGKSRLLAEAKRCYLTEDLCWLKGRGLSYSKLISYWPFIEILRSYAGITEEDNDFSAWNKLLHHIKNLFADETEEIIPYLASLMLLSVRGEYEQRVEFLDGDAMGLQVLRAMRRFFERLAQQQPLVLVFEDLHWVDRSSLELLDHLSPLVKECPLLICLLSRPEIEGPRTLLRGHFVTGYGPRYHEIVLNPLSRTESVNLICRLLQCDDLPRQVRDLVYTKAEGNPLFIEEVAQSLKDIGAVVQEGKTVRWRSLISSEGFVIPNTLRGLITARIDRLQDEVKQVLVYASVIGRNFFYRILKAVDEADQSLDYSLDQLLQIDLIRKKKQLPELEYMFKHALTQDAAYESILIHQRIAIHRKVGETVELLFRNRLEEFYGVLSYHYTKAEEWEKAQHYLFKAADQSGKIAADAEALYHYKKALAAYERVYGESWEPSQRALLERKIGEAFFRLGNHEQAMEYYCSALRHLGYPIPEPRWSIRAGIVKNIGLQVLHRLLPRIFVSESSQLVTSKFDEVILLYELMGWIDFFMNREWMMLYTLSGLNEAEKEVSSAGKLQGNVGLGLICDILGLFRWAGQYHHRAHDLLQQIENPLLAGFCFLGLGHHEDAQGNWDDAMKYYIQSKDRYWQAGNMRKWGDPMCMIVVLYHKKGEFKKSLELAEQVLQVGEESGDAQLCGWGLQNKGLNLLSMGLPDEAAVCLQRAITLLWDIPDYLVAGLAKKDLGRCYLQQGEIDRGTALVEESCRILAEYDVHTHFDADFYNARTEAYLKKAEVAGNHNADFLKKAKFALKMSRKYSRRFKGRMPVALRLTGSYKFLKGNVAAAQKCWQESLETAEKLGAHYEIGATCLEFGRKCGDLNHLERAREIFQKTGSVIDFEAAERECRVVSTKNTQ